MPLYYFGLDKIAPPPEQDGEDLPDDQEARRVANVIAEELNRNNGTQRVEVVVFDATGKPIDAV